MTKHNALKMSTTRGIGQLPHLPPSDMMKTIHTPEYIESAKVIHWSGN